MKRSLLSPLIRGFRNVAGTNGLSDQVARIEVAMRALEEARERATQNHLKIPQGDILLKEIEIVPSLKGYLAIPNSSHDPVVQEYSRGLQPNRFLLELLALLTEAHDQVIDLGAHVGTFCVPAALMGRRVLAIDASQTHVNLIEISKQVNVLNNLTTVCSAITDREGPVGFVEDALWGAVDFSNSAQNAIRVAGQTLRSIIDKNNFGRPAFIKADIEGAELAALASIADILDRADGPAIVYESNAETAARAGYTVSKMRRWIEARGYRGYRIEGSRWVYAPPDQPQPEMVVDLLCLKAHHQERFAGMIDQCWDTSALRDRCLAYAELPYENTRRHLLRVLSENLELRQQHAELQKLWTTLTEQVAAGTGVPPLESKCANLPHAADDASRTAQPAARPLDPVLLLHNARGALLRQMPAGAHRFLSAGCAGLWYFEWIERCYGRVPEHIGIEYYMPRPDGLPSNVTWIENTASDMSSIEDRSCDLVFSGQNVEHMWPDELSGFFLEAARVLRPGGHLVVDSPNRLITASLVWAHPEHTVELTVAEATQLFELAGLEITKVAGIWLCQDPKTKRILPFDPNEREDEWSTTERLVAAREAPEHSMCWWIEGRRTDGSPNPLAVRDKAMQVFKHAWPERVQRLTVAAGLEIVEDWIRVPASHHGIVFFGPYVPLRAGQYSCTFHFCGSAAVADPIAELDVVSGADAKRLKKIDVLSTDRMITVDFFLDKLTFGVQFRCIGFGRAGYSVCKIVQLEEKSH